MLMRTPVIKPADSPPEERRLDAEISGLDALEAGQKDGGDWKVRAWSATWPKLAALAVALLVWEVVVRSGWKPEYVLPGPAAVFRSLQEKLADGRMVEAAARTMRRALTGYAAAVVIGAVIGVVVSRWRLMRVATGSLITGLQTMPSIAWFPLAILLFKLSESSMLFVVVIGAAPSVATGILGGIDHVPALLDRVGVVMGARGIARFRHVMLPAAMPEILAGLKQGWAFAWRSLMAGELIVTVAGQPSIGTELHVARDLADAPGLIATMLVILFIGIAIESVFGGFERAILRKRGLGQTA